MTNNEIAEAQKKCVHFNGRQNDCCKAGVRYKDIQDNGHGSLFERSPCFNGDGSKCAKAQYPTVEEAVQADEESELAVNNALIALEAITKHANGKAGKSELPCPVCKTGTLHYVVVEYNGHRHAKCTTPRCVSFME